MADEKHLWEYDHPYYCDEGNWFSTSMHHEHDSWEDYKKNSVSYGYDSDLNFLFRWDISQWTQVDIDEYLEYADEDISKDYLVPHMKLKLYFMAQRKARNYSIYVRIKEEDEPEIKEWLKGKWEKMKETWAGISDE